MATLLSLPPDILIDEILITLPWPAVASCLATCRLLHARISESLSLSYRKELYLAGMVDNPRAQATPASKLEELRERERRWLRFAPKSFTVADNPFHGDSLIYDLEAGVCMLGRGEGGSAISSMSGWRLPGDGDPTSTSSTWEQLYIGIPIIGFEMSIDDNDLIVLGCWFVFSYSCNDDH